MQTFRQPPDHRVKFTVYRCFEDFINDEKKFILPDGWIEKIEALRKQYPKLNIKSKKDQIDLFNQK
jgi:hypothetical protein